MLHGPSVRDLSRTHLTNRRVLPERGIRPASVGPHYTTWGTRLAFKALVSLSRNSITRKSVPPCARAAEALAAAMSDSDVNVKRAAAALAKLETVPAEPFVKALTSSDFSVRKQAVSMLLKIQWKPGNTQERIAYAVARRDFAQAAAEGSVAIDALGEALGDGALGITFPASEPHDQNVAAARHLRRGGVQLTHPLRLVFRSFTKPGDYTSFRLTSSPTYPEFVPAPPQSLLNHSTFRRVPFGQVNGALEARIVQVAVKLVF